jgi:hypothetical protein
MVTPIQSLTQLDFESLSLIGDLFPSPITWEDQVFYFLMLDRFSDGKEKGYKDNQGNLVQSGTTPLYSPTDAENAVQTEADAVRWREAGTKYVGGTLKGLQGKIGYLKRLGVTALWISPIFKQVRFQETYHGYGIQNFLEVEPHFGTREDLREVVRIAHAHGIYLILDIILNHSGNVFSYSGDRDAEGTLRERPWTGSTYPVEGFNDKQGNPTIPFVQADPQNLPDYDGAVWPAELQDPNAFTRKGYIKNWDYDPEFCEGDFFDLKDIHHGYGSADDYFDGRGGSDRYIRESMFGGEFGAFRTRGVHFFNEDNWVYQELAKVLEIRRKNIVLRRGRQYLRSISAPNDGVNFRLPEMVGGQMRSVVPWSRIFNDKEMLLAINTDYDQPKTDWVTIDNGLHQAGDQLGCIYSTDAAQVGQSVTVEARNGESGIGYCSGNRFCNF